ncbi:MAG: 5'-methylthioadenosine/adenosylhomocysteine nucleosidase [Clostridia bacterium]|nr:5'-methylthioadenosine/adenosylhomocysteine nucleosidase [Clostridia bacterium]
MIGIIGAMDIEVDGIKSEMQETEIKNIAGLDFVKGNLGGVETVVARCNPGKVNAAACAQIMALEYNPELIINPGVAGGIGEGVKIGDLIVGESCIQYDMDTSALGDPVGFISGLGVIEFPCAKETAAKIKAEAEKIYDGQVMDGIIVTGDKFVSDGEVCLKLKEQFGAKACEMESGAIAHVCYMNNIPFVALRSISDNANDDASVDYPTFAKAAAAKTVELINAVIDKI